MLTKLILASALVRIIMAGAISGGGGGSLSINLNWGTGSCFSSGTCTATSATRTFSGSGQIRLDYGQSGAQYSLNAGTFTTFSTGQLLTIANADTLAFKAVVGVTRDITIVDTATSGTIGTCTLENDFDAGGGSEEAAPP